IRLLRQAAAIPGEAYECLRLPAHTCNTTLARVAPCMGAHFVCPPRRLFSANSCSHSNIHHPKRAMK
ncbi:MAG: hypothetical protein K0U29_08625, partial [Gammaproteobacteria bacterium]|nr:hypothetical protein [Gammaproteobacteria bacterium]